jgi:hypothetical protein
VALVGRRLIIVIRYDWCCDAIRGQSHVGAAFACHAERGGTTPDAFG